MARGLEVLVVTVGLVAVLFGSLWLDDVTVLAVVPVVLLVGALGVEWILRGAAEGGLTPLADRLTFAPQPTLLALAALALLRQSLIEQWVVPPMVTRVLLLGGIASLLFYSLSAQRDSYLLRPPPTSGVRFVLLTLVIVAAFVLFGAVYGTKDRTLVTGSAIGALAFAFALELYRTGPEETARTWQMAGITGLVLAETTWVVNYLTLTSIAGGIVLLLVFYVLTGLVQYAWIGALTRRVILEYAGTGAVGLGFVLLSWLITLG